MTNLDALLCGELKIKQNTNQKNPKTNNKNESSGCPARNGLQRHKNDKDHNTCTIDNALYAIHVAVSSIPELTTAFRSSDYATV